MNFLKQLFSRGPRVEKTDISKRFNLHGRVGQGSMSKVWKATDYNTGRTVALKVLDKEKTLKHEARFPGLNKPGEGEIAIQLRHPCIARTLEHGWTTDMEQFLVMEFIEGQSLSYLVLTPNKDYVRNRLKLAIQLGQAIEYFHQQNFIHRDICPRNIMVDDKQSIKLIDFGLVVPNTPAFQQPGNRTGTANYMAPELVKRLKTDQRIDIYSYAVTLYEMWTKRMPWDLKGDSYDAVIQHINTPPTDIRTLVPKMPEHVAAAIMKGLATRADDRWPTMTAMLEALQSRG